MSEENKEIGRGVQITLPPVSESAGRRRSLDERFFVRFPALYRLLSENLLRLPERSRLRRLIVARRIERAYAAANRRDFDLILAGLDPATEYHPASDLMAPDQDAVFSGHDGYLQMWRNWLAVFEDLRFDPEEVLDMGDTFLVAARQQAHGSSSGVAVSQPLFQLFRVRRGLVIWQRDFRDRSEALEAAGLSE